jgi:heat-inducible transcriptional repressor
MASTPLSDRARRILSALVREHIETGEPVGSAAVLRRGGFGLSSATIRNVLSMLEDEGYLRQPHTSAGRVPTDLAYRCYVDLLLQHRRPRRGAASVEAELRERAGRAALMDDVLAHVSHVLSRASHHVGFAVGPENEAASLHRVDFVPLSTTLVLVVLVARGGQVSQKVVDVGERLSGDELQQAANYINTEFAGLAIADIRARVVEQLKQDRTLYDALLKRALRLAQSTFEGLGREHTLFIEGAVSLLADGAAMAGASIGMLRALLKMVEDKQRLVRLLNEYVDGPGLTVVIGAEHSAPDLREFSLVASTWFDGRQVGSIGVIGPIRMRYAHAIFVVDSAAQAVSRLLREKGWDVNQDEASRS